MYTVRDAQTLRERGKTDFSIKWGSLLPRRARTSKRHGFIEAGRHRADEGRQTEDQLQVNEPGTWRAQDWLE